MFLTDAHFIIKYYFMSFNLGTASKRFDNLRKRFNKKQWNVNISHAKDFREYSFLEWLKLLFNHYYYYHYYYYYYYY